MSIIFKGKNSELDFDIYPAKKSLTPPKKKRITETVPFMNGEWDFSKIGGLFKALLGFNGFVNAGDSAVFINNQFCNYSFFRTRIVQPISFVIFL